MDDRDHREADLLNRLWDARFDGGDPVATPESDHFHPAIDRLYALDNVPDPDSAFLSGLRSRLMEAPSTRRTPVTAKSAALGLVAPMPWPVSHRPLLRLAIAAIAAALLIAALAGGDRWLSGGDHAPMVASAMASSVPVTPTLTPTSVTLSTQLETTGLFLIAVPGR